MAQARELDSANGTTIEIDGVHVQIRETGTGHPIVIFGDKAQAATLANGLAARNRALTVDLTDGDKLPPRKLGEVAAATFAQIKLDRFSVIGISRGAELALALAMVAPSQVDKLILLAPPRRLGTPDETLRAALAQVTAPTLVMVGTNDRSGSAETMRVLREKMAASHALLIFGAGESLISERPDACLTPIGEFLERGIEFVVCHESQVLRR